MCEGERSVRLVEGERTAAQLSVSGFGGGGSARTREGWMWILAFLKMWYVVRCMGVLSLFLRFSGFLSFVLDVAGRVRMFVLSFVSNNCFRYNRMIKLVELCRMRFLLKRFCICFFDFFLLKDQCLVRANKRIIIAGYSVVRSCQAGILRENDE